MKHHISYFYNALLEYCPLHQTEWQTRCRHNPPDWGLVSSMATCLALWSVIQQRVYETRVHDIESYDSVYCMYGAGWSSRWLMTQLTNGKRACVLVFLPVATFWTYFVTINLLSLYLMNFMFHTMLDAACNIQRVHYKNMKCDIFIFTR